MKGVATFVGVFVAFVLIDYLNALYTKAIIGRQMKRTLIIRSVYQVMLASGLLGVVANPINLVAVLAGSLVGTYLALGR